MNRLFTTFGVGFLFAVGLGLGGMTDADKVIAFLDLSGAWDPSLAFVMVGAIAVHVVLYRMILKRPSPLMAENFWIPKRRDIDGRLVVGSVMFGAGWGLGGFCPGPGIASIASFSTEALVFVAAMLGGMALFQVLDPRLAGIGSRVSAPRPKAGTPSAADA